MGSRRALRHRRAGAHPPPPGPDLGVALCCYLGLTSSALTIRGCFNGRGVLCAHLPRCPRLPLSPGACRRAKEAAKDAAQQGASAAERLQGMRQQAAAAASTLGEKVQAATSSAQQLASATVEELLKQKAAGEGPKKKTEEAAAGGGEGAAGGQQQQQQGQEAAAEGAEGEAREQQQEQGAAAAGGKASVVERLRSFAASAVQVGRQWQGVLVRGCCLGNQRCRWGGSGRLWLARAWVLSAARCARGCCVHRGQRARKTHSWCLCGGPGGWV